MLVQRQGSELKNEFFAGRKSDVVHGDLSEWLHFFIAADSFIILARAPRRL